MPEHFTLLTSDTRPAGTIRAFEPRQSVETHEWHCRGRLVNAIVRRDEKTRQCGARLRSGQRFCGKCGGLVAWDGTAEYNGVTLKHLERTPA